MKHKFGVVHISILLALISITPATWAIGDFWTSVASTGTVDEADMSSVTFSQHIAMISSAASPAEEVVLRYNILPIGNLANSGVNKTMSARFRDNGANARVILRLIKTNFASGNSTTVLVLDSNLFPASSSFQTQTVGDGCWAEVFDFNNNTYHIEASLSRTTAGGLPGLGIIRVDDVPIC